MLIIYNPWSNAIPFDDSRLKNALHPLFGCSVIELFGDCDPGNHCYSLELLHHPGCCTTGSPGTSPCHVAGKLLGSIFEILTQRLLHGYINSKKTEPALIGSSCSEQLPHTPLATTAVVNVSRSWSTLVQRQVGGSRSRAHEGGGSPAPNKQAESLNPTHPQHHSRTWVLNPMP